MFPTLQGNNSTKKSVAPAARKVETPAWAKYQWLQIMMNMHINIIFQKISKKKNASNYFLVNVHKIFSTMIFTIHNGIMFFIH